MSETKPSSSTDESSSSKDSRSTQRLVAWGGLVLGVGTLGLLTTQAGWADVGAALSRGGPALLLLAAFYPLELGSHAAAWRFVFPRPTRLSWSLFGTAMWMGQSVNRLLPTAALGGDVVRGRLALLSGGQADDVVASLVADKTAQALSILSLLVLGGMLLLTHPESRSLVGGVATAVVLLGTGIYVFIRIQRSSGVSRLLRRWSSEQSTWLAQAGSTARDVEQRLDATYAHPQGLIAAVALRVAAHVALAAEVWTAAWILGTPVSVAEALTLRVVSFAARGVAFVVWGGLGVQEGVYALLGPFVGLSPAHVIALSLATRAREVLVAVPGVVAWLADEGRRVLRPQQAEQV